MKKNLIILDLNGTLLLRKKELTLFPNNSDNSIGNEFTFFNGLKLIRRKGLDDFLEFCFSIADVGIYTSMLKKNINLKIFLGKFWNKFLFVWDRKYTFKDPESDNWNTLKSLDLIKSKFTYDNYIFIDDTYHKVRHIPPENVIICESMEENEDKEVLKDVKKELEKKLSINENGI